MILRRLALSCWCAAICGIAFVANPCDAADTVKVFILAGQSNMEGKAPNKLWEYQAQAPATKELFAHLRNGDGWIKRDDVFIKFFDRHGPLTLGYGSPDRTGVELELGTMLGDHFEEPVLLIKTAWGGHSLQKNFRPPSAGLPSAERLQQELAENQKRVAANNEKQNKQDPLPTLEDIKSRYGASYRDMLAEVRQTKAELGKLFPELADKKFELAGFVWFQGWNDQYNQAETEYAENLRHLIRDVRKDLDAPRLPVVIAAMGQNGSQPATGAMLTIQEAQLAVMHEPEFAGNVKSIRTDVLVDKAAEELYPHWREKREEWDRTGGDFAYHYLGSAIWFMRIGHAMGEAMLELQAK
ncbi:MAG: sialate O-acetylesterase [Pirellulales bacterium]|nr:sialate O-acetylesterase [Pirellulales bacterium]